MILALLATHSAGQLLPQGDEDAAPTDPVPVSSPGAELVEAEPTLDAGGAPDGGVSDEMRAAAESWWRMMYNMQGIGPQDSPHLNALVRKGAPAAFCDKGCDELDQHMVAAWTPDGSAPEEHEHHFRQQGAPDGDAATSGDEDDDCCADAEAEAVAKSEDDGDAVWDRTFFRRVQNRLGLAPFIGDYEAYIERMESRQSGEDSCCSPERFELPTAETIGLARAPGDPQILAASGPAIRLSPARTALSPGAPSSPDGREKSKGLTQTSRVRHYEVTAFQNDIIYDKFGDHDPVGLMYALNQDVARYQASAAKGFNAGHDPIAYGIQSDPTVLAPQPLVLRANQGDTVEIEFTNSLPGAMRSSLYIHKGIYVDGSNGSLTGFNADGTIGPGQTITYTWEIPLDETAEGTYYFYSHADPRYQVAHGLFGALIVEPRGSLWLDSFTGEPMGTRSDGGPTNWGAIIVPPKVNVANRGLAPAPLPGPGGAPGPGGSPGPGGTTGAGPNINIFTGTSSSDFREYVVFYHDRVRLVNESGQELVDTHGLVPDPGGKAFSYRTSPFFNMLDQVGDVNREPLAYSGYTFGDSSTPHPRWYVGDPTSFRILHAGGGEHHVHHNHINRWRRDTLVEKNQNLTRPSKHDEFDVSRPLSNRVDSTIMGPGESFNFRLEGGAGSVERSVGDILFHCHFIEHVVEGMWSYHRVYNTLLAEPADTDSGTVPGGPLAELPDRTGSVVAPVDSVGLRKLMPFRAVAGLHKGELIDTDPKLATFISDQLPFPGVTGFDDATRWDWIKIADPGGSGGELFLGEPLDGFFGPGWPALGEGEGSIAQNKTVIVGADTRPVIKFNPMQLGTDGGGVPWIDGRLAYPHLKPHFNKRPPFAPFGITDPRFNQSLDDLASGLYPSGTPPLTQGTPYMGPALDPTDIGWPSGLPSGSGLTPAGSPVRRFNIEAITLPIQYNAFGDNDPRGQIYVLSEEKADILAGIKPAQPLVLRVNEGDRVEYVITNSIPDNPSDVISKSTIGIHSHLVQYDVQGSDGAVAGMNYETGMLFGETVFQSFYADVELGTVYQHDHQILLQSLPRGLFIALIVEPKGSTHHDPVTGQQILSGTVADVRTDGNTDGFRDFAVLFNDNTKILAQKATFLAKTANESRSNPETGYTSLNLRAEPIVNRADADTPDAPYVYSSTRFGDPSTDLWQAYVGDPVRIRVESAGAGSAHALMMPGHRFRHEQYNSDSDLRDFWFMGPSATRDFELEPGAGGASGKAGDYFYFDGDMDHREEGAWGIFRVFNTVDELKLQKIPGHVPPALQMGEQVYAPGSQVVTGLNPALSAEPPVAPWPLGTAVRFYDVVAVEGSVNYTPGQTDAPDIFARVFLLAQDLPGFLAGTHNPQPLVIRANAGEGIEVRLTNLLDDSIGLMPSLVGVDPRDSLGATLGFNDASLADPGQVKTYRWYADQELGTCMLSNTMDLPQNAGHGLWAALIVEPANAVWRDTFSGALLYSRPDGGPPAPQAVIESIDGAFDTFREGTVFFHDNIPAFFYEVAINYRIGRREGPDEPLGTQGPSVGGPGHDGALIDPDEEIEHSSVIYGDPPLVLESELGDPYRLRVLQPGFHDHHALSLHGHQFTINMNSPNSRQIGIKSLTTGSAHNFAFTAGGPKGSAHAGDFLLHCHIMDHKKVGMWGLFRVHQNASGQMFTLP